MKSLLRLTPPVIALGIAKRAISGKKCKKKRKSRRIKVTIVDRRE